MGILNSPALFVFFTLLVVSCDFFPVEEISPILNNIYTTQKTLSEFVRISC